MGGLRKTMPVTFWTFLIGGLSLSGLPLITAGFWSKDEILADAWLGVEQYGSGAHALVFVLLALAAFMTAFYTMRQISLTFGGEPRYGSGQTRQPGAGRRQLHDDAAAADSGGFRHRGRFRGRAG